MRQPVDNARLVKIEKPTVFNNAMHKVRRIARFAIETPLLVPSFSSRGFPEVGEIIDMLRVDVSGLCLLSAFDLAHGHVPPDFEALADIVIIDSGVYEALPAAGAIDAYLPPASTCGWTRNDYWAYLTSVGSKLGMTNSIVVSYDTYAPLTEQVENAHVDSRKVPGAAIDFLVKPVADGQLHSQLEFSGLGIEDFDIIGFTERELGNSALERCRTLIRLRRALSAAGLDIPIHVFGSITPAAVTAYFLCGADIFDGLNWLRVGLYDAWAGAPSEFAVAHRLGNLDDTNVLLEFWRRNLRTLQRTQSTLASFAVESDSERLHTMLPFAEASLELATAAAQAEGE